MPFETARAPAPGKHEVQIDGVSAGEVLGPGIVAGNARYRRGITDHLAVTGDLGVIRAQGETQESPLAGTTRVGVHAHGEWTDELDAALFAGAGGGHAPSAGSWLSADAGWAVTGDHRYVRPTLVLAGFVSEPVASETFMVGDRTLQLPRTYGVQGMFGFDLGPKDRAMLLGFMIANLWAKATAHQDAQSSMFLGVGGSLRFGLN